jgi:hypothetical protein
MNVHPIRTKKLEMKEKGGRMNSIFLIALEFELRASCLLRGALENEFLSLHQGHLLIQRIVNNLTV